MKKILIILLFQISLFANITDELLVFQNSYTLCEEDSDYKILNCILNTTVKYNNVLGDEFYPITIDEKKLGQYNPMFLLTNDVLPKTKRYKDLENYLTYLYSKHSLFEQPHFKKYRKFGYKSENIRKAKKVLNILYKENLNDSTLFDEEFKQALIRYQKRNGFVVNGRLWKETRYELNKSFEDIKIRIIKNLEIERSLPIKQGTYVYINIPEFKFYYFEGNILKLKMNVVVGKKKHKTPIFSEDMKYIVQNPVWNVPDSIYYNEYQKYSDYELDRKGFSFNNKGKLYQRSGKRNALGLVKFLFPNPYNVYMHDTPSKYLFKKRVRAFSHGCIRLSKPFKLLNTLGYDYKKHSDNSWTTLENKIPVYVEYHTAWIDEDGIINFRKDIYNYERMLFNN